MRSRLLQSALLALAATITIGFSAPGSPPVAAVQNSADIYKDVYNGWKWWHVYCYRCHGQDAVGGTLAPNLIDPNEKLPLVDFLKIVRNGNPELGMQAWDKLLDDKQITQIFTYVRARADKVLPAGRPDEVGPKGGPWVPPQNWTAKK